MSTVPQPVPTVAATTSIVRSLGLAAAVIATLVSAFVVTVQAHYVPGIDFYQFWVVGTELRSGGDTHIYSDRQRAELAQTWLAQAKTVRGKMLNAANYRQQLETYSTPVLYSFFAALSTGDYVRDHRRYSFLCMSCAALAIGCLCRMLAYSWTRTLWAVALFLGFYTPLQCDVGVTNVNQLQLGGLALFLWAQSRNEWQFRNYFGGAVLGLLLAFKPNLAFSIAMLFLAWIINHRWDKLRQQTIGLLLGLAIVLAASVWTFQSAGCWLEWAESLRALMGVVTCPTADGNYGLAMLIEESTGGRVSVFLLAALAGISLFALTRGQRDLQAVDRRNLLEEDLLAISLGTIMMLLSARLVWQHYFVLLIPTAIYCLRPQAGVECGRPRIAKRFAVALVALLLIARVPPLVAVALPDSWIIAISGPAAQTICIALGALMIFGLVIREVQSLRYEIDPAHVEFPHAVLRVT